MGKVARQVVEQAGINVDELLRKLVDAAAAEFTTYYYYTILRTNAIGLDGEGMKEIIEDARLEDRNHSRRSSRASTNWAASCRVTCATS